MIIFAIYISCLVAFTMITAEVVGLRQWYDIFAEKKRIKSSCEWCFSFHLSWIYNFALFVFDYSFQGLLNYPDNALILIPITTLFGFGLYRKLE